MVYPHSKPDVARLERHIKHSTARPTSERATRKRNVAIAIFCSILTACILACLLFGASRPAPLPTTTKTLLPTLMLTTLPTLTSVPTLMGTATSVPLPTHTPVPLPTAMPTPVSTLVPALTDVPTSTPLPTVQPTVVPPSPVPTDVPVCDCSEDLYNCGRDFTTHDQAQACFNYCMEQGQGDVHELDADDDGSACESLP